MKSKCLLLTASLLTLASCAKGEEIVSNAAPTLTGIKDISCVVNSRIDFLTGIAALDKEDGDITPSLEISVTPSVEVKDGYATFDRVGEYTVDYKIVDSGGRTTTKRSFVDVVARDRYVGFDMPSGFAKKASGNASFDCCGMVDGQFVVKAKGHQIAEDVLVYKTFSLKRNLQYTFLFRVDSRCEGKVKALADGEICSEMYLEKGEGKLLSFKHIVLGEEEGTEEVEIALALGDVKGDIDLVIREVECEYPQEAGKIVDLTPEYSFLGNVIPRIENGCEGNAWAESDGKGAVLEITKPIEEIWLGGMFVNTGVTTKLGCHYIVSFDLEAREENDYEVFLQRDQWKESHFQEVTLYNPKNGHYSLEVDVDDDHVGPLFIYVQSGTAANRIAISSLRVEERLAPTGKDYFPLEDFQESHRGEADTRFNSKLGSYSYHVDSFARTDGEQQVRSPSFFVSGSGNNYCLSFKAKASAPIEVIVVAPISDGWDPTLTWNRITLSEKETAYSFFFYDPNGECSNRDYVIVWQFGSEGNAAYHNVDIEISDVEICLKNRELDG